MSKSWAMVPLEEVLKERHERPDEDDLIKGEIRIVEKIGFNDGIIQLRNDCQTKTGMILIKPGDLVVSGINAAKGAIAIYGEENKSSIAATIHYGSYIPDKSKVDVQYLWRLLRSDTFRDLLQEYVPGGIKTELRSKRLLPIPIPIPSLEVQHRIMARIEELATRIEEARELRRRAVEGTEAFAQIFLDRVYSSNVLRFGVLPLDEACITITDGDHLTPSFTDSGVKFIFVGNVSSGIMHFNGCKYVDPDYYAAIKSHRKPQKGDVLYSAIGATLGIPAIVNTNEIFCFQRHVALIRPDPKIITTEFLWYMLRSKTLFKNAWSETTGSAQPTVPLRAIRALQIPVPPKEEQCRIVSHLDSLQTKLDALKRHQAETAAELDALMPSILERAFKGDL